MCVGVSTHNSFMKRGEKLYFNYKDFGVIWHHALDRNFNLNEFDSLGLNECDISIVTYDEIYKKMWLYLFLY